MAIRFDKDTRRATNGPMIFFSDPSAEICLCEEIRGAINSRLSFYAYRRPGDLMVTFGSSEGIAEGIGNPGFVIAPFMPDGKYYTIPYKPVKSPVKDKDSGYSFPSGSTSQSEHEEEVRRIQEALSPLASGKIIAARVSVENRRVDVANTFTELSRRHPDAFVFCFSTPATGCWLGASPELLLEADAKGLRTVALAGTRPSGTSGEWDIKNIEEQEMVAAFIKSVLQNHGFKTDLLPTRSQRAGKVEHLCTPLHARPSHGMTTPQLESLLRHLSPTPALCGTPRDLALDMIRQTENFSRAYYGGFCGPYHSPSDFSFYVNLRCCLIEEQRCAIFTGGGITLRSEAIAEWNETSIKSSTICDALRNE